MQPLYARYVKIKVIGWKKHIALRVQFYGCDSGEGAVEKSSGF